MRFKNFYNHLLAESIVHVELGNISADDFNEYFRGIVPDDSFKNSIYIDDIYVDRYDRDRGYFSNEIRKIVKKMNQENKYIFLQAYPYESRDDVFERDQKRLIEGYESFGFVHVAQGWMYKEPQN